MNRVSVIVPARNEPHLQKTVDDLLSKAAGDIEVFAVCDGYWPNPPLKDHPKVVTLHFSESRGMRNAINSAASLARGNWYLKCDAHTAWQEGWDETLKADCEDDWVVIPRRDRLDAENWRLQQTGKPPIDYHYLAWPYHKPDELGMHGNIWPERAKERAHILIDDEMSSQGSAWFMRDKHFRRIGGLPEEGYGKFVQEFQQIGLKTWLGGGRVVVNKKTTYLHWHKGAKNGRGYFISKGEMVRGTHWSADYWLNDRWPERKHNLRWLVEKFNPPTWPENWEQLAKQYDLGSDGLLHKVR
jgi:glycosyltransferase involved in cell wall biosynthesis